MNDLLIPKMNELTRGDFVRLFFYLRKEPVGFEKHRYALPILNNVYPRMMMKCSRQVAKSTVIAFNKLADIAMELIKTMRCIYVSPSRQQAKTFSEERLQPLIDSSPEFQFLFLDKTSKSNVFFKKFANGGMIFLRGAYNSADRVRGIPGDKLYIDEFQDLVPGFLPALEASLGASPLAHTMIAGTPKHLSNPIEVEWQRSSQTEWVIPCDRHSPIHWNVMDETSVDNIGKEGLICDRCGKPIDSERGRWHDMKEEYDLKGFHMTQLAVSWKQDPQRWKREILIPYKNYEEHSFYNEIVGVSWGQADRPVTQADVKGCCYPNNTNQVFELDKLYDKPPKELIDKKTSFYAGIDWGEGKGSGAGEKKQGRTIYASFTVVTIGYYVQPDQFAVVYWKKYTGKQATNKTLLMRDIIKNLKRWNIKMIAADWGYGPGMNDSLMEAFGYEKVCPIFEHGSLKELLRYDDIGEKYIINRTIMMSRLIDCIKEKKIYFPKWKDTSKFSDEITAIIKSYSEKLRRVLYEHSPTEPDDSFHSLMFAKLAAELDLGIHKVVY